ncbi:SPOSA6832_04408, partial [Sporobolomyces salmonicolor]
MYIPQLWGSVQVDGWTGAAKAAIKAGATHLQRARPQHLKPTSAAAALWSSAMEPLATSAKLVSSAVTNGVATADGQPMGVPWLKEFVAACSDCTIDAVALHWYDSAGNNTYFQSYLEDAYANLSKSIWLTEYMETGTPTDQATFMVTTVDWLEKQDYIEKYAAYELVRNQFITAQAIFATRPSPTCKSPTRRPLRRVASQHDLGKAYSDTS